MNHWRHDRDALAASDHYARRLREILDDLRGVAPYARDLRNDQDALLLIERARSAELRDPEPGPWKPTR